ncbi:MAG: nickel pincer cofactor biosynthesis protein LarB [Planctomycetaceae bacterium]
MQRESLTKILQQLQRGELSPAEAAARLHTAPNDAGITEHAHVDLDRAERCGFPEVVFCEGKSTDAVVATFETLRAHGQPCLGTRASGEQAAALLQKFPEALHNAVARTVRLPPAGEKPSAGKVAVITAGSSDRPVAEEAVETLRWMGCEPELIADVGVAGPHRLGAHRDRFADADAIVVVAGMEGALPSVVGGWVSCPVIAVPTSIGYGAAFGGLAALLGMLNSCAANVTVVNIDAGFKAGYVAGLIALRVEG